MRSKKMKKALCFALAAGVFLSTPLKFDLHTVYAEGTSTQSGVQNQVLDGVNDEWKLDEQCKKGGEVVEKTGGYLHFASGINNGNGTTAEKKFPAVLVNPNEFDFSKEGYFSFKLKSQSENTNTRFGIYLGYTDPGNAMFIGYDGGGWFWQKYKNGDGPWYSGSRIPAPETGKETEVEISWTADKKITVKVDGVAAFKDEDCSAASWEGNKIAVKAGTWGTIVSDVLLKEIKYIGQKPAEVKEFEVKGTVVDEDDKPVGGVEIFADSEKKGESAEGTGEFTFKLKEGAYILKFVKQGFETTKELFNTADNKVLTIKLEKAAVEDTAKIISEEMEVTVDKDFPRVAKYSMKKAGLSGKTFYGQPKIIRTIRINGEDVKLKKEDVTSEISGDTAKYTLKVKNGGNIDAVIKAFLKVEKTALSFEITEITNNLNDKESPIETVEIPEHGLISVKEGQADLSFKGAVMSSNTTINGDEDFTEIPDAYNKDFMYAFISADGMSAGLWSNSENDGRNKASFIRAGGASNTRILAQAGEVEGKKILSLSSAKWYYHRKAQDSHKREYIVSETEMPKTKIVITGNENDDDKVDWQDGAIAFRSIMNNPYKSEEVPELVSHRIAMNFGGQAQNPFLTTLDNVKRVALHTDGLGQSVILKGYANEGHDSGHPDYYDIGKRIGGAKDMNILMEKGKDLGARFGIHINCGEMYPEAKAFNDDSVRRDNNGNLRYGWNWIDQGVGLDSVYDLATGNRKERFDKLKELVKDNLDFIYVDIWGNETGGNDDTWQTRKLSKEINERGWRMTTEWGPTNEYDSTFQHWAADLTYGGYKAKGENSAVMRFLRNHQKDSWVANYHRYGGAALAPLLGGYNMKDFEGWQGRNDYDAYIQNLYEHNLTTKFIQHFKIVKWEDGKKFSSTIRVGNDTLPYEYTAEKRITLKNDEGDVLVLERVSDDINSEDYYKRTITLNGKIIATGAEPEVNTVNGNESYLLPWLWDAATGARVDAKDEKLYHFNNQKGETTWELPDSWKDLADVKIYKLTDLGKQEEKTLNVSAGKITISAEAKQPYVIYKGSKENLTIKWSEGMHLVDTGFNSGNFDSWTKTGSGKAEIAKSQFSNPMMKLTGNVAMSQKITDLIPDRQYAVLVGVDNRSDSKAMISITAGDKKLAENYTVRSIAKNYVQAYTHSNKSATVNGSSYFQHMYVFFKAPSSGDVTLTLSKLDGEGEAYFDDVRVVESDANNITFDENGEVVKFTQDFENSIQGLYPFVIGEIEGVEDNRIHLSELHAPYTQAGWDVKKMDDVLYGNWSVKINGLVQRSAVAFKTIPQNFRFEPGVKYNVSFKYQSGSDGIYAVVRGVGEKMSSDIEALGRAMGPKADSTYSTEIIGDESGQTWIGIYSTNEGPNLQGARGNAANFGGYKDFVLDNLVIERVDEAIPASKLKTLVEKVKKEFTRDKLSSTNYRRVQIAIAKAEVALQEDVKNQKHINTAYYNLNMLFKELIGGDSSDASDPKNDIPLTGMVATAGSEQLGYNDEGPAKLAIDNNENTIWHTKWSGTQLSNMWLDIKLKEATEVAGIRVLQRTSGGQNGRITKADIMVLKKGQNDYEKVKTVGFNTSGWNVVTFTAIKDVTHVKLQALSTLGDEPNKYASLAEFRILKEEKPEDIKPDKKPLKDLVAVSEKIKKAKAAENDITVLEEKIKKAKAVLDKEDASYLDILLAEANLKTVLKDLENGKYKKNAGGNSGGNPGGNSGGNPGGNSTSAGVAPVVPRKSEDKKNEDKKDNSIEVKEDKTPEGSAKSDTSNTAKTLKKDKRILKALNEVKTETKMLRVLQTKTSKKLNIVEELKNFRRAAKNDKAFMSIKKDVNRAISFVEKNKITNVESMLKKLSKLDKQLKKLQVSKKNVKNEAKIKKLQKEISNIRLVIHSLENSKKFFRK